MPVSLAKATNKTTIEEGFSIISGAIDLETINELIDRLASIPNKSKTTRKGVANYGRRDILNLVPKFRQFANMEH